MIAIHSFSGYGRDGRRTCYFGGGGGSSNSSNQTTTQNTDKRLVVDSGIGISSDSSTVTVNSLDAGIVGQALNTVQLADATNGQGFGQLLSLADKLFVGAGNLVAGTQQASLSMAEATQKATNTAYQNATAEKSGTLDNKTIMILGVAAAAAMVMKGKK